MTQYTCPGCGTVYDVNKHPDATLAILCLVGHVYGLHTCQDQGGGPIALEVSEAGEDHESRRA